MLSIPKEVTNELLEKLYIKEEKSLREIGNLLKKSPKQVSRYLKKFGIQARPFSTKGLQPRLGAILSEETKDKIRQKHLGKKLSDEHKRKLSLNHKNQIGEDNPCWKGGKYTNPAGYIYLRIPNHPKKQSNGYYPEHRYVVEQNIGRILDKFEHIHHINGIKGDNGFENLEIVNAQTHNLITMMEIRIKELEKENKRLRNLINLI